MEKKIISLYFFTFSPTALTFSKMQKTGSLTAAGLFARLGVKTVSWRDRFDRHISLYQAK